MSKNTIPFLIGFVLLICFSSFFYINGSNEFNENEEVKLLKTSGGTRSATTTVVGGLPIITEYRFLLQITMA
jgi:hypothetical protein